MNPPTTSSSGNGNQYYYLSNNTTQWSKQETIELITIRGNLEREFSACKRNKILWESIANSLTNKGFFRSPHQCKSKWKNLVNRYKGKETSDLGNDKQCPFFEQLHDVFSKRAENLQHSLVESQSPQVAVQLRKRMNCPSGDQFSDDSSQDEGDDGNREGVVRYNKTRKRKRKTEKEANVPVGGINSNVSNASSSSGIHELLRGFVQQQQRIEMQWMESSDRHQREREVFEHEWRESMEKREREWLVMEQAWREKEEQRKIKEEIQTDKRDVLLTSLLNKLINQRNL